jgi:hypothetical protein
MELLVQCYRRSLRVEMDVKDIRVCLFVMHAILSFFTTCIQFAMKCYIHER